MAGWRGVDDQVNTFRLILGIVGNFPATTDAWRLAAHLAEYGVEVEVAHCPAAIQKYASGGALILIPDWLGEEEAALALLEEIGHWLEWTAVPEDHLGADLTDEQRFRAYRRWQDREENRCEMFVLAWRLPVDMLYRDWAGDEELMAESGCTLQEIYQRRMYRIRR